MKYLVTGGAGFIGSHLVESLLKDGHSVRVLDDFSSGTITNLSEILNEPHFELISGSILNREIVEESFVGIDGCFHMAAAVGVEKILKDPIGSLKTNIQGSENVFEIASTRKVPLLLASTSEIYGKNTSESLTEDSDRIIGSPLLSRWTYAEAKALDESLAIAMFKQRGLQVKIIRYFNTVGPRQSADYGMVIPRFFTAAKTNKNLIIHGTGEQRRVFCHIDDAVRGTIALWNLDSGWGDAFNLGGIDEISILALAQRIVELMDSKSGFVFEPYSSLRARGFEDMLRRVPNTEKLQALTGWSARNSIDEILRDYAEWLRR